jgi:protein-S-isoprenylcysteine O-methyltransferase Ste14
MMTGETFTRSAANRSPTWARSSFWAGTFLRLGAVRTLGPRHSVWVAVQSDHSLVTTGLYRFIRHPSYVGALLAVFGWALSFRSGAGLLLAILIVPPILSRIRAEEHLLLAEFGDEYQTYQRRTWRLLPFVY